MRWFALFLAVTLAGCVSPVVVDHRTGTDFDSYRTYAIDPPEQDEKALSLDGQRVQEALQRELAGRPLDSAGEDAADLLVRYRFVPVEKFQGSTLQFGFGWFGNGYGLSTSTPVEGETYKEYKLQVAFVDRGTKKVVWEATSRDTLYESLSSERRAKRIDAMVADMLKRYPPTAS
ncbi:DUF4136 domain-containing protein [Alcanivorax sp. MM125-6]|nr:DUF4136 domain-containing protein [Alcanivorax sp. ZXX171]MCQ6260323.1 DUF4136 domain-containing protein [Alcanivorax sp. MM125-6]